MYKIHQQYLYHKEKCIKLTIQITQSYRTSAKKHLELLQDFSTVSFTIIKLWSQIRTRPCLIHTSELKNSGSMDSMSFMVSFLFNILHVKDHHFTPLFQVFRIMAAAVISDSYQFLGRVRSRRRYIKI